MTALLVASCASSSVLTAPAEGCSSLVPDSMKARVPHATLGDSGDATLDWQLYGTAETGQLNIANSHIVSGWAIVSKCEARDAATARRINAPAWQFWR